MAVADAVNELNEISQDLQAALADLQTVATTPTVNDSIVNTLVTALTSVGYTVTAPVEPETTTE